MASGTSVLESPSTRPVSRPLRESSAPSIESKIKNALTIDLEDWPVAVLGPHHEISHRVVDNTLRLLNILRRHEVCATFFVLTRVAEKFPDLIREVARDGHEIASHGHAHQLLTRMTPDEFRRDVQTSIEILERLTFTRPLGYRAPAFSIVRQTRWAGPILAELGFTYDSSIFPIRHRRYGIPDAPRGIHRWSNCDLIEIPPATLRMAGVNIPIAGGGYFRLWPREFISRSIARLNRENTPAVLYLHPYELDVNGIAAHQGDGIHVGTWRKFTQQLGRSRIEARLNAILGAYSFCPLRELI